MAAKLTLCALLRRVAREELLHGEPVSNKRNRPSSFTTKKLAPVGLNAKRNVVATLIPDG